jgi:hypothetical protein
MFFVTVRLMAMMAAGAAFVLIVVLLVARAVLRRAARRVAGQDDQPSSTPLERAQKASESLSPEELERFRDWLEKRCRGEDSEGITL